jgi:energy-coupling factor transporter transmembrane protein EcfT
MKVAKGNSPMSTLNKYHLFFTLLYLTISIIYFILVKFDLIILAESLIGLIVYFFLHYSIFLNFFALAQRSISSSLLILLYENNYSMSKKEVMKKYANDQGFGYIKMSRIDDMRNLKWIELNEDQLQLTNKGRTVIKIVLFILNLLGLQQIGINK